MENIKLCMKYDTCRRCPKNKICESIFRAEKEKKQNKQDNKKG